MVKDTQEALEEIDLNESDNSNNSDTDSKTTSSNNNSSGQSVKDRMLSDSPNPDLDDVQSPVPDKTNWFKYLFRSLQKMGVPVKSAFVDLVLALWSLGLLAKEKLEERQEQNSEGDKNE